MRMKALALLTFLLLLFSNISYASKATPDFCKDGALNALSYTSATVGISLALLALTISFDVVAIAYMINKLFPHVGVKNWLQNEYWELAKSAIIIAFLYGTITFVGNLTYHIMPVSDLISTPNDPGFGNIGMLVAGSETYLCNVNTNLTNVWGQIGTMAEGTGVWASLQVGLYIPIPTPWFFGFFDKISFLPFANWMLQTGNFMIAWYGSIINDLVNFILFPWTTLTVALIELLPSLAYVGLTFFIPMGLIFRALPFVRGIGGTLIAIGIAMCIVLPATLVLFNFPVTNMLAQAMPIAFPPPHSLIGEITSVCHIGGTTGHLICAGFAVFFPAVPAVGGAVNLLATFGSDVYHAYSVFSLDAIYIYMNNIMKYGIYVIIQMLLFVIDLIVMYPIVDTIAKSMGGTIRLSLGEKLKLA